jgi:hypothetical protein
MLRYSALLLSTYTKGWSLLHSPRVADRISYTTYHPVIISTTEPSASTAFDKSKNVPPTRRYRYSSALFPQPKTFSSCLEAYAPSSAKAGTRLRTPIEKDTSRSVAQKADREGGSWMAHSRGRNRSSQGRGKRSERSKPLSYT